MKKNLTLTGKQTPTIEKKKKNSVENRQCCAKRLCYFARKKFNLCTKYLFPCLLI